MKWTIRDLLGDEYEESEILTGDTRDLPITDVRSKVDGWKLLENPNRYTRLIKIGDETKFNSFVMDILELQSETGHHARMTIQFPQIKLEVWTHTLSDVTEVDQEWCQSANDILGSYQ